MFGDIAHLIVNTVFTLFGAALILRVWMLLVRLAPQNPVSSVVFQMTDWIVLPLRRVIPPLRGIDLASVMATWLAALVYTLLSALIGGGAFLLLLPMSLALSLFVAVGWAFDLLFWMTLLLALLSWVNPHTPVMPVLARLLEPLLAPLRRHLPQPGGIDLSPLVLIVLARIVQIVLARLTVMPMLLP